MPLNREPITRLPRSRVEEPGRRKVGAPVRFRLALTALSLSLLSGGSCSLGPRASLVAFVADLSRPETGTIRVELRLRGAPGDTLAFSSFIQPAALRLDSIEARQDREFVRVIRGRDERGFERLLVVPRVPNRPILLTYTVRPGAPEEIAMSGPTGYRFGHLGSDFGLFGGRQLFLLPMDAGAPRRIDARFLLPPGWSLATPWRDRESGQDSFRLRGPNAATRLIDANLGAGRFESAGDSGFRVQVLRSIPDDLRRTSIDRALALERDLADFLGRPSEGFELILVPKAPDGMLLSVAPGGNSWGLSLGEGVATRWMSIGRAVGRAHLGDVRKVREDSRWILESLPTYLLTGISERSGWRSRGDWLELFYYDTAALPLDLRDPRDLGDASQPLMREWRGALVLDLLSREPAGPRGHPRVEDWLRDEIRRGRRIDPARWIGALPRATRARMDRWLAPTAGAIPFPGRDTEGSIRLHLPPAPSTSSRGARVDLYVGGRNLGLLEQCGCRSRQAGGLARRATILARARREGVPSLAFELGDAVPFDQHAFHLDDQKRSESDLVFRLMAAAGQTASVVSHAELSYGPSFLRERIARLPASFQLASANVSAPRLSLASAIDRRLGGVPLRLVGLEDPGAYHLGRSLEWEDAVAKVRIEDPVTAASRVASRSEDGLTVVAGSLSPGTVRDLLAEEAIDLIVTNDYFRFTQDPRFHFERPFGESLVTWGWSARTLVVLLRTDAYALARLRLVVGPGGKVAGAQVDELVLDDGVPDDPAIRRRIDAHYERLALESGLSERGPIGNWLRARHDAAYSGAASCASCHATQTKHWESTMHATAYATLLAKRRQGVPGCFACHVTGYRQPTGYRATSDRALRNVQCESCHGPGADHVRAPSRQNIVRAPGFGVCSECHDPTHSEMTEANFLEYRARVVHSPARRLSL